MQEVVYGEGFWFLLGVRTFRVEGTPLIDPDLLSKNKIKSNFIISYFDPVPKKQILKYVDDEEFKLVNTYIENNEEIKFAKDLSQIKNNWPLA